MTSEDRNGGARPDPIDSGAVTGRDAVTGRRGGGRRGGYRERSMVPRPDFTSYYGRPVLHAPNWEPADISSYLFLGGLAGGSSVLAAGAQLTGRPALSRAAKVGAAVAIAGSLAALVHDLGRPARFVNMLRVFKPTSPMSVGSWLLAGYAPLVGGAAASALTGRVPRLGALATGGAALFGPAVAAYTAVLISDTAVPAWHDGYREMPFLFVGSAAADWRVGPRRRSRPGMRCRADVVRVTAGCGDQTHRAAPLPGNVPATHRRDDGCMTTTSPINKAYVRRIAPDQSILRDRYVDAVNNALQNGREDVARELAGLYPDEAAQIDGARPGDLVEAVH